MKPNICKCGCLRPCGTNEYFNRHDTWEITRRSPIDYIIEDRGYETPCWIWQLCITKFGYAKIKVDGRDLHAHTYYYEQYRGQIPKTKPRTEPDHLCRVRSCVNPWHIEIVTQLENIRRGNVVHVARERFAKVRQEELAKIGILYSNGLSQSQIAKLYGVQQSCISRILRADRWKGIVKPTNIRSPIKLNSEQVFQIRDRIDLGESQRTLAREFKISDSQISRIVRGESWAT